MHIHTLVIGYGNRLRGDDGIGPALAEIVNAWKIPGVQVLALQQLAPELVEEIKQVRRVLFIDAMWNANGSSPVNRVVEPRIIRHSLGHHETPENLLALTRDLEGCAPAAWLLTIPAISMEHGEEISAHAQTNMEAALTWVRAWLTASD